MNEQQQDDGAFPQADKKEGSWWARQFSVPVWALILSAIVLLSIGSAMAGGDEGQEAAEPAETVTVTETVTASEEDVDPPSEPARAAQPDGEFTSQCDYLLGDFSESESGYRFVAGADMENTGNIGLRVQVAASWTLLGADPVTESREVELEVGQSESVQMTVLATQDQIDAHQSANGDCSVDVSITETFGTVQD